MNRPNLRSPQAITCLSLAACVVVLFLTVRSLLRGEGVFDATHGATPGFNYLPPGSVTESLQQRSRTKNELAAGVLNNRICFWQALEGFRKLHADDHARSLLLQAAPGTTEDEALARNLIVYLRSIARNDQAQNALVDRLESELQQAIDRGELPPRRVEPCRP